VSDLLASFDRATDVIRICLADPEDVVFNEGRSWGSITRERRSRRATTLEVPDASTLFAADLLAVVPSPDDDSGRRRPRVEEGIRGNWTYFDREADIVWIRLRAEPGYVVSSLTSWGLIDYDETTDVPQGVEIWSPGFLPADLLDALPDPLPPST
jgi:hypothetical protein